MSSFGSLDEFNAAMGSVRRAISVRLRFDMSVENLNLDQALDFLREPYIHVQGGTDGRTKL